MQNDFNYLSEALQQYASGSITYGVPVGAAYADGTITFGTPVAGQFAGLYIDIVDYTQLPGKTVTVDGNALVEGVDWTAATDNNTTGTSLAAAIDALANFTAAGPGHVTISYATRGVAGNGKSVTTDAVGGIDINGTGVVGDVTAGGVDGDTIEVDGSVFTYVSSAPGGSEFTDIAGLTSLVDALPNVTATDDGSTVSVIAAARGVAGNSIGLVLGGGNAGTMAVSGATLTGGVDGDTIDVNGSVFTCVESAPGASQFSSISELEALVEAVSGINSTQDGTTITVNADAVGAAGNAITLALGGSNAGTMAISGATLTGGVDATYTDTFQMDLSEDEVLKVFVEASALTSGATVTITPQTSIDGSDWQDLPSFTIGANGDTRLEVSNLLEYNRFKIVVVNGSATSPSVTLDMHVVPANVGEVQSVAGAITLHNAQVFNNVTTTANGNSVDASQYDFFTLLLDMQKANTPTNLYVQIQFSDDGVTWYDYDQGLFGSLGFNQAQMGSRIYKAYTGRCMGKYVRAQASATGTTAVNTFTLTAKLLLKN